MEKMYTDSIEHESEFLRSLMQSDEMIDDLDIKSATVVKAIECPICHKGTVLTEHTPDNENGQKVIRIRHFCDSCKEEFVCGKIKSDIFLNTPYQMVEKIETPYGDVHVDLNGKRIPFRYRVEDFKCITDEGANQDHMERVHIIALDFSESHPGDIVFCGFDDDILEYNDADEGCALHSSIAQDPYLGFCVYEPDEKVGLDQCFHLESFDSKGVEYQIDSDPRQFNEQERYWEKFAVIALMWINKNDYGDPDNRLFDLTYVVA